MKRQIVTISVALWLLVLALLWTSHAEPLKLVQGYMAAPDGKPLANQTLVIEGKAEPAPVRWWPFFSRSSNTEVKRFAITDGKGFFQLVDLPAGTYTLKLTRPGETPVPLKKFDLESGYAKKDLSGRVEGWDKLDSYPGPKGK
jgi:hypothetical protein